MSQARKISPVPTSSRTSPLLQRAVFAARQRGGWTTGNLPQGMSCEQSLKTHGLFARHAAVRRLMLYSLSLSTVVDECPMLNKGLFLACALALLSACDSSH